MSLLYRISNLLILTLLLFQVSSKIIQFEDSEAIYKYDNESEPLGKGRYGAVFKGIRIKNNEIETVAFKLNFLPENESPLKPEADIFYRVGSHESIPKFYHYFSDKTQSNRSLYIMELLGINLHRLRKIQRHFSIVTVTKIGLQMLDVLEHIHNKGVIHNDVQSLNLAISFKNDSRIYIYDFGLSKVYNQSQPIIKRFLRGDEDIRRTDMDMLSDMLFEFATGNTGYFDNSYFKEVFEQFEQKAKYPRKERPDYDVLRNILRTELEKHKNEPNYDKFDWQIQRVH